MAGGIRVLYVEDDPDYAEMVAIFLERESDRISVEIASSAAEGLDRLDEEPYDCVVSDYDMPDQTGIELLRAVREDDPNLPFILFTGMGSEEVASEAIVAGVTDYLQKQTGPERYSLLGKRILNSVEHARAKQAAARTERRMRDLAETTNDILWMFSADWDDLLFINSAYEEMWGQSPEVLREEPRAFLDAIHPDDRPMARDAMGRLASGESVELELRVNAAENFARRNWIQAQPIFDEEGNVVRLAGVGRDITERKQRERELEQAREYFAEAERLGNLGAWEFDADGNTHWTEGTRRLHGVGPDYEPTVQDGIAFFHPDDRSDIREAVTAALERGESFDIEARLRTRDGEERWVRTRGTPRENGSTVRGFIQDITPQKEREIALEEAKIQLEAAIDAGNVGTWQWHVQEDELIIDPAFADTFGVDPAVAREGLPLERFTAAIHEADIERVEGAIDRALAACGSYEEEYRVRNAAGDLRWIIARGEVECDDDGRPIRFPGLLIDFTDRKQWEQKLERYRVVLDTVADPVYFVGPEGDIEMVNDAFAELVEYDRQEIIGSHFGRYLPEEDVESGTQRVRELLQTDGKSSDTIEIEVHPKEGETRIAESRFSVLSEEDEYHGTLGIIRDVTERKRNQQELERQNERLEEFAAVISHDLRNPLSVAEGRLDLAKAELDSPHLDAASDALEHMDRLIEDLLTLARQGESVGEATSIDLARLVDTCWRNVRTREATLSVEIDGSVRADEMRLRQLIGNLLGNAIEHGGESVEITIGELPDGFYVEDDGPGIPPESREDVFDAGYSTSDQGTGFGLSIVREIADAHGWDVRVTEGADGGARFEFTGVGLTADDATA